VPPFSHPPDPLASGIGLSTGFTKYGASTVDHQSAQVTVTALADPEQPGFTSAGSLSRNQPQPGGKLTSVPEAGPVTDCRDERGCRDRPDPFYLSDALTHLVRLKEVTDPLVVGRDALIKLGQFLMYIAHQIQDQVSEIIVSAIRNLCKSASQARNVAADHNTMFSNKASDLVYEPCAI
jgi:hypothetical protein